MSAPTTLPIAGINSKVTYQIGTGTVVTIAHAKWDFNPDPKLLDLPNSTDGRRRVAALPDYEGTISCKGLDTNSTADVDLIGGTAVTLYLYPDGVKKYGPLLAIIGAVKISNEVEGSYDADFNFMMAAGKTLPGGAS